MAIQCSVFIATSLDGYIARSDGSLDWLDEANKTVPEGEDCGYLSFMNSVDVLVMGRNSFEKVLSFGDWPYGDKQIVVMSRKGVAVPLELQKTVSVTNESPKDLVNRLEAEGAKRLYIDGGLTIQSFMQDELIDDFTITLIPVILGGGKPLFASLPKDVGLKHIDTKAYDFGFVQVRYETKR